VPTGNRIEDLRDRKAGWNPSGRWSGVPSLVGEVDTLGRLECSGPFHSP
jgi:hypothetical protein